MGIVPGGASDMKRPVRREMVVVFGFLMVIGGPVQAAHPPSSQTAGGVLQRDLQQSEVRRLEERIDQPREKESAGEPDEPTGMEQGQTVLIHEIRLDGATLLTEQELQEVAAPWQGKEMSFRQMQRAADEITAVYRRKGYVTSRAYLPPQGLEDGILVIRVIEGKPGTVRIQGNKHFSSSLLRRHIDVETAGSFDYSALQRSLVYINEHPDRVARAVLMPGQQPGTTDVLIEVEDTLPIHAGIQYDNWGSQYINRDRYAAVLEYNNLTGHDDKFYLKGQIAENQEMGLGLVRYLYPVSNALEVGAYTLYSKVRSGEEFAAADTEGRARIAGLFATQTIFQDDILEIRGNLGFDYKSIRDDALGLQISRDEVRVIKAGMDCDYSDPWGRSILTMELEQGLPSILGAMEDKDPQASRSGAGAKWTKAVFNLFRLQPLPASTALLWKNTAQITNHRLIAAEQFQIGGATSVRGFPPAEFSGDQGLYTSLEWSIPLYFVSREARVPFYKKDRWYDVLRFVVFWDWAYVSRTAPSAGEEKTNTLQGAGFGIRLNLTEHLDARLELGYPLSGPTPSDGDHMHPWVEFSYQF